MTVGGDAGTIDSVDITERRLALVVVDVQNKFADASERLRASMRSRIPRINEAIDMFRSAGAR